MAENNIQQPQRVQPGDISNYEEASDKFLHDRKADLRAHIRHPILGVGEFLQNVVLQAAFSAIAIGLGTWNGVDRALKNISWFHDKIHIKAGSTGGSHAYVADVDAYRKKILSVGEDWAAHYYHGVGKSPRAAHIADRILEGEKLGFKAGMGELRQLREELVKERNEVKARTKLHNFLKQMKVTNKDAYVAQFDDLFDKINQLGKNPENRRRIYTSPRKLAESLNEVDTFVKDITDWNRKIVRKYARPATIIAATGAVLVTGWRSFKTTKEQKTLQSEGEMSHIERIQAERVHIKYHHSGNAAELDEEDPAHTHADRLHAQQHAEKSPAVKL